MRNNLWKLSVMFVLVLVAAFALTGCATTKCGPGGCGKQPDADTTATDTGQDGSGQTALERSVEQAEAERGVAVTEERASVFADVLFEFDRFDLTEAGKKTSQAVAAHMREKSGAKLLVEGHCDSRGTAEYNMALGDRRATSVKNYLVSLGVPAASVTTVSYGKERLLDQGAGEGAHARNRRAHFVLN